MSKPNFSSNFLAKRGRFPTSSQIPASTSGRIGAIDDDLEQSVQHAPPVGAILATAGSACVDVIAADDLAADFLLNHASATKADADDAVEPVHTQAVEVDFDETFSIVNASVPARSAIKAATNPSELVVDGVKTQDMMDSAVTSQTVPSQIFPRKPNFGSMPDTRQPDPAPAAYIEPQRPLSAHRSGPSVVVRALRADIKAASIVTDLVSALAQRPGSGVANAVKIKLLTGLLSTAHMSAAQLIEMVNPKGADVGWVKAQALSATASMLAYHWYSNEATMDAAQAQESMDAMMLTVRSVFDSDSEEIAQALECFEQGNRYKVVDSDQSMKDHWLVAVHSSAWAMARAIDRVKDARGEVFTYGLQSDEIVARLLPKIIEIVNNAKPEISDSDACITYLRGAMRRATHLIMSEYVGKTRETCKWVDCAPDASQWNDRLDECPSIFEHKAVPFIAEWGTKNFHSIERASKKLIEETDEAKNTDRRGA